MTTTAKIKTPVVSKKSKVPAFNAEPFFAAGLRSGHADAADIALVKGCKPADVEAAQRAYVLGYITSGIVVAGTDVTAKDRALAEAILDGVNPDAKSVPEGKIKRTAEQHALARAGARKFNRARNKAGIVTASNIGGARPNTGNRKADAGKPVEAKPVTKSEAISLKAKDTKDAAAIAHKFRESWVHFQTAIKELALSEEARGLAVEITTKINAFEKAVLAIKPDAK